MTREQLEHAIRAVCDLLDETEVYVFGSQSILGAHPDATPGLLRSMEVDISPIKKLALVEQLNSIGEDSPFHRAYGFYVHGVPIDSTAILPRGWRRRTVTISSASTRGMKGHCLDGQDLAASKLAAFRDKDRDFVRELLIEKLISPRKLVARIWLLPIKHAEQERLARWVRDTVRELTSK